MIRAMAASVLVALMGVPSMAQDPQVPLFAFKAVNPDGGADGLLHGNAAFFFKEVGAVAFASVYAFVFTYLMLYVIDKITPVKVSKDEEEAGLDQVEHGEAAYL